MKQPSVIQTQRRSRVRCFYGIKDDEPQTEIERNGGRCPICLRVFNTGSGTKPHIEHDHDSGWFRGVTCENCNHGLGAFHDDVDALQRAIDYLISNATPTEFNIGTARASLRRPRNKPHGEHLDKIKAIMVGNKFRQGFPAWNKDKPWSGEAKDKMRRAKRGKTTSETHKANTSAGIKLWWEKRKKEGVPSETQVLPSKI